MNRQREARSAGPGVLALMILPSVFLPLPVPACGHLDPMMKMVRTDRRGVREVRIQNIRPARRSGPTSSCRLAISVPTMSPLNPKPKPKL